MKNTVLLIDANVILSYITNRKPGVEEARKIMDYCRRSEIEGYIAFHTVSIVWYVLRKRPQSERRPALFDLCELLTVTGASHRDVLDAIMDDSFPDFEDCLQEKCAKNINADFIVTENVRDFATSKILALTPKDMIARLRRMENE